MAVVGAGSTPLSPVSPREVLLWSGAGVSVAPPTNLPSGRTLTQIVVESTCLPGTWGKLINEYFIPANITDAGGISKEFPRLEAVLESVTSVIGLDALSAISMCGHAPPNNRHKIIANHVKDGGTHITTNFDRCIELCLPSPFHTRVIHLHGIYDSSSLANLGARLSTIAAGLPSDVTQQLSDLLSSSRGLAFLGYSGSDFFDINPFFRSLYTRLVDLSHLQVVWLKHARGTPVSQPWLPGLPGSVILKPLQDCGAAITYMEGDADLFLHELASAWSLPSAAVSWGPVPSSSASRAISPSERLLATAQLFTSMGIGKEVVKLQRELEGLSRQCSRDSQGWIRVHFFLNDGYRNLGRYSDAIKLAKKIAGRSGYSILLSTHRLAGDCWLRGDHYRAARYFLSAFFMSRRWLRSPYISANERSKIIREQAEVRIAALHWLRDVGRHSKLLSPLSTFLALCILKAVFRSRHLIENSPHALTKLARLHEELDASRSGIPYPADIQERFPGLRHVYQETDSIIGTVNYLRRDLTKAYEKCRNINVLDVDHLYFLSRLIDDRPGMLKAALLRRAALNENTPGINAVLDDTDWSARNRKRWIECWKLRASWP